MRRFIGNEFGFIRQGINFYHQIKAETGALFFRKKRYASVEQSSDNNCFVWSNFIEESFGSLTKKEVGGSKVKILVLHLGEIC